MEENNQNGSKIEEELPFRYVTLADGQILKASAADDSNYSLWIWMDEPEDSENSMAKLFGLFSDENKTRVITEHLGDKILTWENYTRMMSIQRDSHDIIHIRMRYEIPKATN